MMFRRQNFHPSSFILHPFSFILSYDDMSELDQAWAEAVATAEQRAQAAGRADVAAYLRLRASNDLLRQTSIDWLLTTFTALAGSANHQGGSIQMSREDGHRFPIGNATMVGQSLTLKFGVRAVQVEVGWPRLPKDGIVRGGGLACGRVRHLGRKSANEDLLLVRSRNDVPRWMALDKAGKRHELLEASVETHIKKLLTD